MKEFFEEYGRTIVTVLIILGIILVGYTIAGNGTKSALGRFATATVDSLSGQTSSILRDSTELLEKSVTLTPAHTSSNLQGSTKAEETKKDGVINTRVTGKSKAWSGNDLYSVYTDSKMYAGWGKKSVMSFDISADRDFAISLDFNADIDSVSGNDKYSPDVTVSADGIENRISIHGTSRGDLSLSGNRWHHVIVVLKNENGNENPSHLPMRAFTSINYMQDSGTVNYQLKNVKYGIAD